MTCGVGVAQVWLLNLTVTFTLLPSRCRMKLPSREFVGKKWPLTQKKQARYQD